MRIDISTTCYEELQKSRLFFLRLHVTTHSDNRGNCVYYRQWQSIDSNLSISFNADSFADFSLNYCLCIIDTFEQKKNEKEEGIEDTMVMDFHAASADNESDWIFIFTDYARRARNCEDKYAFMYLLWMLDKKTWSEYTIKSSMRRCNSQTLFYLFRALNNISRCLSGNKQNAIVAVCRTFDVHCQIYQPPIVTEMYRALCNGGADMMNKNLFELIDSIFESYNEQVIITGNNPLAAVLGWFHNEEGLQDYSILNSVFSLLSEDKRLDIVKRYFHDIRLNHTTFAPNILSQFKDNDFDEFIRYRYCLERPTEPIELTIPLLCDNILTLHETNGSAFQTFNGVLDLAVSHCDFTHPSIKFKFERFIPRCNGGAVRNPAFMGFIDYSTIRKIDESKLTEENLFQIIYNILERKGQRDCYWRCQKDESLEISGRLKWCKLCENVKKEYYTDKWIVSIEPSNFARYTSILNTFLKEPIRNVRGGEFHIDRNMLSTSNLKSYIMQIAQRNYISVGNNEFIVNSSYSRNEQTYDMYLIEQFSEILRMRIFPKQEVQIGEEIDILGFWRCHITQTAQTLERNEVRTRVINSLRQELNSDFINDSYFELTFDRELLNIILHKYYYNGSNISNNFLVSRQFRLFCSPELSNIHNQAIDLPYFWCRGSECFRNNLELQTLERQNNWHDYSLYHITEILGYPKLHKTEAGYEPDNVVGRFISNINKVAQKFRSLKCRKCGHMLFSSYRISGFNQQNHYACLNPSCEEYQKLVYLNFCYNCAKGLIDSRDTRRCPNGWHICPACLSCCNNSSIERIAQRYILSGRLVPERIESQRGHGHNDNGEYFCPQCGNPVEYVNENASSYIFCSNCGGRFNIEND